MRRRRAAGLVGLLVLLCHRPVRWFILGEGSDGSSWGLKRGPEALAAEPLVLFVIRLPASRGWLTGSAVADPLLRRLAAALDADVRLTAGHDLGSVWFETHAA